MTERISPDHVLELELLAAINALRPDGAPLAAALVRAGCVLLPDQGAMLAMLDSMGHADTTAGTEAAQTATLAAWRCVHECAPGSSPDVGTWLLLAELGIWDQAHAAMLFALRARRAIRDRATAGAADPVLH